MKESFENTVPSSIKWRYSSLDSLRGAAILLVMVGHMIPQAFPEIKFPLLSSFGGAGVLLFFYLSGFLIYKNIQTQTVYVFLVRRFFKLMPTYWASIVVIVILAGLQQGRTVPDFRTLLANILLIQDVARADLLSGVYWTLLIEAKFYVVMVLFCSVFGCRRINWLFFGLIAVNVLIYYFSGRGSLLTTYLISFFPGIVAAKLMLSGNGLRGRFEYCMVGVLSALSLYLFLPLAGECQSAYGVVFLGVLFAALRSHLCSKFLEFFGRISYSHYLFHTSIGYPLIDYIADNGGFAARAIALLVASVVTVGVATVSYYIFEKTFVDIGYKVSRFRWPIFQSAASKRS